MILIQTACNLGGRAAPSAEIPTNIPEIATAAATPTAQPLHQRVSLESAPITESGKGPDYELKAQIPLLEGSDDPRVEGFNQAASQVVQREIDSFKQMLADMSVVPIVAGSSFDMQYSLLSSPGNILSIKFDAYQYADGAAHPFSYSVTLNYDLEAGQEISLGQLFLPDTDYLPAIATYCQAELGKRDIGFDMFSDGANPTPENYRNWNITPDGLLITFDPYQVAAYAAGPQIVLIPYATLKDMIDPQGPLGNQWVP